MRAQTGTVDLVVLDSLVLSIVAILFGLFVGLAGGGRLSNLALLHVRWRWLLLAGGVIPLAVDALDLGLAAPLVTVALVALLAFALANLHLVGMTVVAIGVLANVVPIVLNDGMPVRASALVDAGLARADNVQRVEIRGVQRLEEPDDRFVGLSDIVPVRATRQVMSFGDLIILVGLADVAANLTRRRVRVTGRLPSNAGPALVAIAPPPERVDAAPVISMEQIERVVATGYAKSPASATLEPDIDLTEPPSPIRVQRLPRGKRRFRDIPYFDTIVLEDDVLQH